MRSVDQERSIDTPNGHTSEIIPTIHLFCKGIANMPSVWIELCCFLDSRGAPLQQHSSQEVILTHAHGLYPETEDRNNAVKTVNAIISFGGCMCHIAFTC